MSLVESHNLEPKQPGKRCHDSLGVRGLKGCDKTSLTVNHNDISYIVFQYVHI